MCLISVTAKALEPSHGEQIRCRQSRTTPAHARIMSPSTLCSRGPARRSKPSSLRQIGPLEKSDPWQRRFHPWAIVRWRTIDIRVCISAPEIVGVAVLDFRGFVDATRSRNSAWEHGKPLSRGMGGPALRTVHPSRSAESPSERAVQGVTETAPPRDKTLPVGRELVLMKGRAFLPLLTVPQGRAGDA